MIVFDDIIAIVGEVVRPHAEKFSASRPLVVNRDLNGRVRLIVDEAVRDDAVVRPIVESIAKDLAERLAPHSYEPDHAILWEDGGQLHQDRIVRFELENCPNAFVVDRLAVENDWATVSEIIEHPPRVVFYSIKGGVGRTTSLAATAWQLAQTGKNVLVFDMDLESPGLSSLILPPDRRPRFGLADWLVEDLVDNGDSLLNDMVAISPLSSEGDVLVVASHGAQIDEYLSKLGRVWMPKHDSEGRRESWYTRLARLLDRLISLRKPDIVLIDSRSGIDEIAAACLTCLGATQILLFAIDGDQTWTGYRMIFRHWRRIRAIEAVRERLQVVGAMIPELERARYLETQQENAWKLFQEEVYDDIPPGVSADETWSFDRSDESAPHFPRKVLWHRGLAGSPMLYDGLGGLSSAEIEAIFGDVIDTVASIVGGFKEA